MKAADVTRLLLLVWSTGSLGEETENPAARDEATVWTAENTTDLKIDEINSTSILDSSVITEPIIISTSKTQFDDAHKIDDFVNVSPAQADETNNNDNNDNTSSSSASWTSLSASVISEMKNETLFSKAGVIEGAPEPSYTPISTLEMPTVSNNTSYYTQSPEAVDNNSNSTNTFAPEGNEHENSTDNPYSEPKAFNSLYIVLPVVAVAVVVLFVLYAVMMCQYRDQLCRKKSRDDVQLEPAEATDFDVELYSTATAYTNFRNHGPPDDMLSDREQKLMIKMESEDDFHEYSNVEFDDPMGLGRSVSPEGLVYVTVDHSRGQENKKPTRKHKKKKKEENKTTEYVSIDFDKTALKARDEKGKKEKKSKIKQNYET